MVAVHSGVQTVCQTHEVPAVAPNAYSLPSPAPTYTVPPATAGDETTAVPSAACHTGTSEGTFAVVIVASPGSLCEWDASKPNVVQSQAAHTRASAATTITSRKPRRPRTVPRTGTRSHRAPGAVNGRGLAGGPVVLATDRDEQCRTVDPTARLFAVAYCGNTSPMKRDVVRPTHARQAEREERTHRVASPFSLSLGAIVACALVIRVIAAFWWDANTGLTGDAHIYVGLARAIGHGSGFVDGLASLLVGHRVETAAHPPLWPSYLSVVVAAGHESTLAMRLWATLPGTGAVLLIGLTARGLGDERTGLLAAALAAVSITLFAQDVGLWSEGMFIFTIALTLYAAYRFIRRPDMVHALLLGGAITLATLTRAEAAALYVCLLVPLALTARGLSRPRRLGLLGAGVAVALALLAPWAVYNSGRFAHPVYLSTGAGPLIVWANCPQTYYGKHLGGWVFACTKVPPKGVDSSVVDLEERRSALRYVRGHLDRLPVVIPVRILRTFGFYQPDAVTAADLNLANGRQIWFARLAVVQYWAMLLAAVAGAVVLHRRRVPLLPFGAMLAIVLVITVFGYGTIRFRAAFDAVLPVLTAVGVQRTWRVARSRTERSSAPLIPGRPARIP